MKEICVIGATLSYQRPHGGVDILASGLEPLPINLDRITSEDIDRVAAWAGERGVSKAPFGVFGLRLTARQDCE